MCLSEVILSIIFVYYVDKLYQHAFEFHLPCIGGRGGWGGGGIPWGPIPWPGNGAGSLGPWPICCPGMRAWNCGWPSGDCANILGPIQFGSTGCLKCQKITLSRDLELIWKPMIFLPITFKIQNLYLIIKNCNILQLKFVKECSQNDIFKDYSNSFHLINLPLHHILFYHSWSISSNSCRDRHLLWSSAHHAFYRTTLPSMHHCLLLCLSLLFLFLLHKFKKTCFTEKLTDTYWIRIP